VSPGVESSRHSRTDRSEVGSSHVKRGDWVRTSPTINKRYSDRVGRIVADNIEKMPTRTHVELGVQFEAHGVLVWFLSSELAPAAKPRRVGTIPVQTADRSRAEHLVVASRRDRFT
jgi:hypothetical protein